MTRDRHLLDRVVFFSDAVFAIAITLLVIELHPPERLLTRTDAALWTAVAESGFAILGFVIGFGVIALFWAAHHRAMAIVVRHDRRLAWRNLGLMFAVALMPFPTAILCRYFVLAAAQQIYLGALLLTAIMQLRLFSLALGERAALVAVEDTALARALLRRAWALPATILVSLALTFVVPWLGVTSLIAIAPALHFAERWRR